MNSILASRINPAGSSRVPAFVRPAAQAYSGGSVTFTTSNISTDAAGNIYDSQGHRLTRNPDGTLTDTVTGEHLDAQGNTIPPASIPMPPPPGGNVNPGPGYVPPPGSTIAAPSQYPDVVQLSENAGMSQADQTALFDMVSSGLNTTGATIAAIINSGDQLQISQLKSSTDLQIAALNQQAQQAQAAGNLALASQNAQRSAQLAQFQQAFLMQPQSKTGLYIVAGVVVLGIIGAFVYFGASTRAKSAR